MVNGGDIFEGWVVRNSQPYRLQTVWFEFEDSSNLVFKPGLQTWSGGGGGGGGGGTCGTVST